MDEPRKEPQLRGLYGKVKIPVKVLDTVIIVGFVLWRWFCCLVCRTGATPSASILWAVPSEAQKHMYAELIDLPEPPTGKAFTFAGWYQDKDCIYEWDLATAPRPAVHDPLCQVGSQEIAFEEALPVNPIRSQGAFCFDLFFRGREGIIAKKASPGGCWQGEALTDEGREAEPV